MADYENIARDPDLFLRLNADRVVSDESQLLPAVFPALRVAIASQREKPGRFVISGSSSPELLSPISESLAGRIAIIEMGPLSLAEAYKLPPSPFYGLIGARATAAALAALTPRTSLDQIASYWLHGGYPEPWIKDSGRFRKLWMQNYLETYFDRDLPRLFPGLDRQSFKLFVQMLAQLPAASSIIRRWRGRLACRNQRHGITSRSPTARLSGAIFPLAKKTPPSASSNIPKAICATAGCCTICFICGTATT